MDRQSEMKRLATLSLEKQQIADLRALVSIAVWIRSEQLTQKDVVRLLATNDPVKWTQIPTPMTRIDTRALVLSYCVADQENAIRWWNRLDGILKLLDATDMQPSWRQENGA